MREMYQGLLRRTRNPRRRADYQRALACPAFPDALDHVWRAFLRLSARRGSAGFGINPISWPDIDAFTRLSSQRLAPWEIRLIEQLDDIYRAEMARPPAAAPPE